MHLIIVKEAPIMGPQLFVRISSIILFYTYSYVASDANVLNTLLFNGEYEFIDLTYPFDKNTINWPTVRKFDFIKNNILNLEDGTQYADNEFATSEHVGTHVDAPYHFNEHGQYVADIPLDKLIVPLIIADVSSMVNDNPNFVLHKHHLDYMLNDNFGKPCLIVFKFGWSKFATDRKKYFGMESNNTLNFPGLSVEVVEWITTSYKNIVGIAVDVASVDPGSSKHFEGHKIAAAAGLYNIENVNLWRRIPEYGCTAIVMPMKIAKGTGGPVRLVAICPKETPVEF